MSTATTGRMISLQELQSIPDLHISVMGEGILVPLPEATDSNNIRMTVAGSPERLDPLIDAQTLDQLTDVHPFRREAAGELPGLVTADDRVTVPLRGSVEP